MRVRLTVTLEALAESYYEPLVTLNAPFRTGVCNF